jgi:hypothetical protein
MMTLAQAKAPIVSINLPPLHEGQREIAESRARFKVVCCGRRWGKTLLGVVMCLKTALEGGRTWWVGPTYTVAMEGWEVLLHLVRQLRKIPGFRAEIIKGRFRVVFPSGGSVQVRSGADPQKLRGAGLDGLVLDECAFMKEEAWSQALRPTVSDKLGWVLFISTPKNFNWFYDLWTRATSLPNWQAWQKPTRTNPYMPKEEIEQARIDARSDSIFRQEYEADFEAVGNAIYELDPNLHMQPIPEGILFPEWQGAIGVDYGAGGNNHPSAVVAITPDSSGHLWVRETWLGGGDVEEIARQVRRMCETYRIVRGRTDPNQEVLAQVLSGSETKMVQRYRFNKAIMRQGAREGRIGIVQGLLKPKYGPVLSLAQISRGNAYMGPHLEQAPGLILDRNGPGNVELFAEMKAYHWEPLPSGALRPQPEGEDRVAALEYGAEELQRPIASASREVVTHSYTIGRSR